MSRVLSQYASLPVPPGFAWSAEEWEALRLAGRSSGMDQRYTTEMFDRFLVLKLSGRPVFLAQVEEQRDGSHHLRDLGCEGDEETFNRSGFDSDKAITDMFVGATRGLIDRYRTT
jgi:hypothetical protein